jgi:hypothetical protein
LPENNEVVLQKDTNRCPILQNCGVLMHCFAALLSIFSVDVFESLDFLGIY